MVETQSLREWIRNEVWAVLDRKTAPPSLLLWCDPDRAWRDLLRAAIEGSSFELWCEDEHELILRDRLLRSEARPRIIWLPRRPDEITYLKVFEIQAEHVWTESLVEALCRFGVEIPRDREAELHDLLPAHTKEWIDRPRPAWRELTVGTAKTTLVDDDRILVALARPGIPISEVVGKERMGVFARRVTEDLGLPAPSEGQDDPWRVAATARLLVTEAAARVPADPPSAGDPLIPPGPARERALKLLDRWQKDIEWMAAFEDLARRADATTSLVYWARNLGGTCPPLASRAAEDALFQREVSFLWGQGSGDRGRENRPPAPSPRSPSYELARLEDFDILAKRLEEQEGFYSDHARGFWACRAEHRVPWASLVVLAGARPAKEPMAVIVLDACRFDLGARLVERLNQGEPARRAEVTPTIAPLPSVTALGMAFALADDPSTLHVELTAETPVRWRVTAAGTGGNLTAAEVRREWLRRRFKLKTPAVTEVKADKRILEAQQNKAKADEALEIAHTHQERAQKAIQNIGEVYHPYDMETGAVKSAEKVSSSLEKCFSEIEEVASEASLPERCFKRIKKARRVVVNMVATIAFFFLMVRAKVEALGLPLEVEEAVFHNLIPGIYLHLVSEKAKSVEQRHKLKRLSEDLLAPLKARDGPFCNLDQAEMRQIEQVAEECAQLFQRSSSCVEGRNGQLSLRHHSMHRISDRKLAALTTVHNYFLKRSDGTTAAERFFGTRPRNLFEWVLGRVDLPGRPAQKRSQPKRKEYLSAAAI